MRPQHVVLEQKLELPAGFSDKSRLECYTVFDSQTPAPAIKTRVLRRETDPVLRAQMVDPDFTDSELSFGGEMTMRAGRAFSVGSVGEEPQGRSVHVGKQWAAIGGLPALIEAVEFKQLEPLLARLAAVERTGTGLLAVNATRQLRRAASASERNVERERAAFGVPPSGGLGGGPAKAGTPNRGDTVRVSWAERLSGLTAAARLSTLNPHPSTDQPELASHPLTGPAVIVDWEYLSSQTNFTFPGDQTFFVTNAVYLDGVTTIEGSACVKFSTNSAATITINGTLKCETDAYRPAFFTAQDFNGVGETISGSAGNPSNYYGGGLILSDQAELHHVRFSHLRTAVDATAGADVLLRDVQFTACGYALALDGNVAAVRNGLFWNTATNFFGPGTLNGEHLTVHNAARLAQDNDSGGSSSAISLTNCLLVTVTNLGNYATITTNSTAILSSEAGVFQTVAGGSHYLSTNSPYRNAGTTNVNADLLAALRTKTVHPPIAFTNTAITNVSTLGPQAQRDTDPNLALGYHYDPVDWIFGRCDVEMDLTFEPGTVVGWFRYDSAWGQYGHGIHIADHKVLSFDGRVNWPCYFVHQTVAQEQWIGYAPIDAGPGGIVGWGSAVSNTPVLNLRFTRCSGLPIYRNHFRDSYGRLRVSATDCEFYGGGVGGYVSINALTNCLFDRAGFWLDGGVVDQSISLRNCTWHGGGLSITRWSGNDHLTPVSVRDCAFDASYVMTDDAHDTNSLITDYDFNAFLQGANRTTPQGANDVIVTNFNWQTSWLGNFYLPTGSLLIDEGSVTNAGWVGLFHHTVTTNQVREGNSPLDIGCHYIATDANGNPLDTDGDSVPDYLEDVNGNGNGNDDPTSWLCGGIEFHNINVHNSLSTDWTQTFQSVITNQLSDGYVVVDMSFWSLCGVTVTNVTYGGTNMTELAHAHQPNSWDGENRACLWGLAIGDKSPGTNEVVIYYSGPDDCSYPREQNAAARTYRGVNQATPTGTNATGYGTGTEATVTVSSAAGELVVDCVSWCSSDLNPGTNQVLRWKVTDGGDLEDGAGSDAPGTNTVQMSWTFDSGTNQWELAAIPLKPACVVLTNQPPTVTITNPVSGQLFLFSPTNILIQATASDSDGTITNVAFAYGTNLINDATAPYEVLWENVTWASNYTLTAIASDNLNAKATNSVSIMVNAMPVITNNAPTNVQEFPEVANVGLTNTAWDPDVGGSVTNVTFYWWSNSVATALVGNVISNGLQYSFLWTNRTAGHYPYHAVATDNRGAGSSSPVGVFKVNPTSALPTVWITYPTNTQEFRAGADITIAATATNWPALVTNVEFFVNSQRIGSDTNTPFSITVCCWEPGSYDLLAKATDNSGASTVSTQVTITVAELVPGAGQGFWSPTFGNSGATPGGQRAVPNAHVHTLTLSENGFLYAGGYFGYMNGISAGGIARWDGTNWSALGEGLGEVKALSFWGQHLLAGGDFPALNAKMAKWDGTNWTSIGSELDYLVRAIAVVGSDPYIGGDFSMSGGNTNVQFIARLEGTNWVRVGSSLNGPVQAITAIGNKIYVGGSFTNADGTSEGSYIARLEGTNWVRLGSGVNGRVRALAACGESLFVGGDFTTAGGHANANHIARWDGSNWWTLGNGVNGQPDSSESTEEVSPTTVYTITVDGNKVFVGGSFTNVNVGPEEFTVGSIAQVIWNETEQRWTWYDLDQGIADGYLGEPGIYASLVRHDPTTNAVDLFVGGQFRKAGSAKLISSGIGRWSIGQGVPTNAPRVSITLPSMNAVFTNPVSITNRAAVIPAATNISFVEYYLDGVSLGQTNADPYELVWSGVSPGIHRLSASATDLNGRVGGSRPVFFSVKSTTNTMIATDDFYSVLMDSAPVILNVLTNDTSTNNPLQILRAFPVDGSGGTLQISYDKTKIIYAPHPGIYGTNILAYSVTDGISTNSAYVTVNVRAKPQIQISAPDDRARFSTNVNIVISGNTYDWDGTVSNVTIFLNEAPYKSLTAPANGNFSTNWTTNLVGFYTFKALATDNEGLTNVSYPVTVVITNGINSSMPIAQITNLTSTTIVQSGLQSATLPVIREGLFNLRGRAYDPDGGDVVAYSVVLFRPEDWESAGELPELIAMGFEPFADVTPGPLNAQGFHIGGDTNGNLGDLDLTAIPNGVYDLVLRVRGGTEETNAIVRVQLDSNLKIGQFSFSEQDLTIPVSGVPLTVIRTYNSLNPRSGDFGVSWTYALNTMDVEIDEQRATVTALDTLEDNVDLPAVNQMNFSMRVGGGRNVTLTLPDGRRTTFQFTYAKTTSGEDCPSCYDGEWIAPLGVNATLTTLNPADKHSTGDDTVVALFSPLRPYWQASGPYTPLEAHDIPTLVLTTEDGTKFYITRDATGESQPTYIYQDDDKWFGDTPAIYFIKPHPGKPKLTKIVQRSGDVIEITDNGIFHKANGTNLTRSVWIERDASGRISAIRDPNSGCNGLPVIKYVYNRDTGNLIQVHRLQDRVAGTYTITKYHYDHPAFTHHITSIEDPRGVPLARNEYDDDGRLTAVVDADGKRTEFEHNTSGKLERVIDRLGNTNTFAYDTRGNVVATTNALQQITTMSYDDFNNKTNEVVYLNGQPYATNNYVYSTNLLLVAINALGHSNSYTYNANAQVLTSTDARANSSTNFYDNTTGNLIAMSDALGNVTSNYYSPQSLLLGTRDVLGTLTTNKYDSAGNLVGSMTYVGSTILSSNTFAYDANGDQTNSVAWRRNTSGTWLGATNTTIYDGQNRVVQTIAPDGGTNTVVYNSMGKQDFTIDAAGHTNRFDYDAQGRLFKTTYPDGKPELAYFDAEGRRTNSVDRAERSTIYKYDPLGRMTNTTYVDGTATRTVYDGVGRVQFSIDARGATNAFGYDLLGRRTSLTNALGTAVQTVSRFGYDANGNQLYFTNAAGVVTTNVFDALNRQTQTLFADGTKQITLFDGAGRRTASVDQANITNWFAYDGVGRLTFVTNALGKLTQYQYDEAGNLTNQVDALSRSTAFEYDSTGRRTKRALPGNQSETFGYALSGNLIRHTNFNGVIITNQYDVLNRLTNRSSVNGYQVSYGYSVTSQRTNMVDASGTTTYAYDVRDRLTNTANLAGALSYGYDANGNVTNITSTNASGTLVSYQYDSLNRLTNVIDGRLTGTQNTAYRFDAVGNLQSYTYPNSVTNLYQYDSLNRLTNLTWKSNAMTLGDFSYKLGLAGNRTNLIETVNTVTRTNRWGYDPLYRLTNDILMAASGSGTNAYTYDDVGNRLTRTVSGFGLPYTAPTNQTFSFDKGDRLDDDGNPATASTWFDPNGNTTNYAGTFQYDVENRLTNANNGAVIIVYNGDGQRVKKITSTRTNLYLMDSRNPSGHPQVLEELTVAGATTILSCAYTYGLDLISQRQLGVATNFYGYDGLGSVRFLLTLAGSVTNTYVYDAYGTLLSSTGTITNNYRYTGEQLDTDLGLYFLRARYLDPDIGRFQTMDTYEGYGQDPLSLHKYIYAEVNPISKVDPSGHSELDLVLTTLDTGNTLFHTEASAPLASGIGAGGPDVTKTLKRTLLEVERTFNGWSRREKLAAANELRNWIEPAFNFALGRSPDELGGAAGAWDIVELHEGAENPKNYFTTYVDGARYTLGTGPWQRTVAFQGRCYYAHAVNYAIYGKMNRLCYDYFRSEEGQGIDTMALGASYSLERAQDTAQAFKHLAYGDYGLGERQAKEFVAFGYNGTLPSFALPSKPSGEVKASVFQWVWSPLKRGTGKR